MRQHVQLDQRKEQNSQCDHGNVPPRGSRKPYEQVTDDLRKRLRAEEWPAGTALPSTEDLASHYQVAKGTVTRALRILADEGLVHTIPRWATIAGPAEQNSP
jgi:DNA-binding transcriptional regulator YhcF (GntR family)